MRTNFHHGAAMPSHKHPELARKIAAAVVSYVVGAKSMDQFLEQHVPENVAPIWHELAALFVVEQKVTDISKLIH
jgi:hypothetical protein